MADCCAKYSWLGRLSKPGACLLVFAVLVFAVLVFAVWGFFLSDRIVRAETSSATVKSATIAPAESAPGDAAAGETAEGSDAAKNKPVIDPGLSNYQPAKGITGRLKSVGSDTMNNLLALWSEDFRKFYPSVRVEIEGKGSGTAPPALIQGTTDFGPMSRDMNPDEIAQFTSAFGYPPTQLPVAIDMLAVFVHQDNPLESLTLEQLDALFSVGRKKGFGKEIRTWGDLGLTGDWANKPISLYGRNPASGTYVYFKEHVLEKGDFKPTVKQLGGCSAVIQGVATDKYAIGYSGIGYKTADVKVIPLARNKKSRPVPAEPQYGYDGTYPLSRFLLLSINYKPKSVMTPSTAEFIRFVFSRQGQTDVIKEGFLPVPAKIAERGLNLVGLPISK
jgi:phosphate transport system substrate-binding protein